MGKNLEVTVNFAAPCLWDLIEHLVAVQLIVLRTVHVTSYSLFYQELLKEKSNPRLKGNRKGIIVEGKEFYIPILNTFPTR